MNYRLLVVGLLLVGASAFGQAVVTGAISSHVDSIIDVSPGDDSGDIDSYVEPTTTERLQWRQVIQEMLDGDYASAATIAASLNYRVVQFTDTTTSVDRLFWVLERTPSSTDNHWGTFVFNDCPRRSKLVIQAPHPLQNTNTGKQGIRVFSVADAWIYCLAGTHKCNSSAYSSCSGTSTSCSETSEPYRLCDQAHAENATFQLTTEEILAAEPEAIVIQPHGYTKGNGGPDDPDIIMSNGVVASPAVEYLVPLRDAISNQDNTLTFKIAHIDTDYTYFLGQTNLQGRLVNGSSDPCNTAAGSNSGRFIHLEQAYSKLRDSEENWYKLANAVALTFAADGQVVSAQSGSWTDPNTWSGDVLPTASDDVLIDAGHTISVDDQLAECRSLTFGDTASHIDMNANSQLDVYGDFTLFSEEHNVFSAGWSATDAYVRLVGSLPATLSGWSTSGGSTSFRDLVIDKTAGVTVTTGGNGMRFAVQNSLEIISGTFILADDDDFEARWASSANFTDNQNMQITVHADGGFELVDGDGTHWIRSQTGSTPVGPMTVYGNVVLTDASSSDISIANITVEEGGVLNLGTGLGSSTYGPELNPGTITINDGGELYSYTTSDMWFDTTVVVLNRGGLYSTSSSSTVFPPTFANDGRVRYQRTASSDQEIVDTDYFDIEFSFTDSDSKKLWSLGSDRLIADSLEINNSVQTVISAATPQTLTVDSVLRLTSGSLDVSDANTTLELGDGATVSRATGELIGSPLFAGTVNVRYTSSSTSISTGPELPSSSSTLNDLTVYSSGQTVTLSDDVVVNGNLTLSTGTFDNNGSADNLTTTMAGGATIRRATADLTAAPAFAGMVNLEYISTVSHVTTGYEVPTNAATLQDVTISGSQGVTLGADVTVNGTLSLTGSNLYTDVYDITLADGAWLDESSGYGVVGTVVAERAMSQSVTETFSDLGVDLTAEGASPGVTAVTRVTGDPQSIDGVAGISRYVDITPAVNSGLNATMVFYYEESELLGIEEDSLALYSSTDGGATWTMRGGTVDPNANTVTLGGIDSFSRWTLGGAVGSGQLVTAQSGSWTSGSTWAGGVAPESSDDVLINDGHTISVDDTLAVCRSLSFGSDNGLIDMNAGGRLTIYGDMTLFSEDHNVFSAGWSASDAYVLFAGDATQTLSGWSTSGSSTSFRDVIIEKDSLSVIQTSGTSMRLCIQNSLEIRSGRLLVQPGDDIEARWASSGNWTNNQELTIVVDTLGVLELVDGDGTHFIRSGTGSSPIGPMTIYGTVVFEDASSYDISIAGITIESGGRLNIGTGLGSSTYGPEFNPGTVTIHAGGELYGYTTSDVWFDTTVVMLNRGGVYKTSSSSTVFPPTFVNDGRVRYQRDPSTATSDQEVVDTNYFDLEFSFNGNETKKLWTLSSDRVVADSLEINNDVETIVSASSPQTLTVDSVLRLTSGSLDVTDGNVGLVLSDGASVSRATGELLGSPTFAGVVDVRYTSSVASVTTGPELPTDPSSLRDLTIYSSDQTVTLGSDAVVNGELTLSMGVLDNNGAGDDKDLTVADGGVIRRATGELTVAPTLAGVVDVEYISTVGSVVTGVELPSTVRNLGIVGNQGVTLGSDVTVTGELHLADSILQTGAYAVTLGETATLQEDSVWVVQGRIQTTRTVGSSTAESFGGLGLTIEALGSAPGATTVTRVTDTTLSVSGGSSVSRYFAVVPSVNTGLNATVMFSYGDRELGSLSESELELWLSTDGGSSWTSLGGVVDTSSNTVSASGVGTLGLLTVAGAGGGNCTLRGDMNCDGAVNISDMTYLISFLFSGGAAPCFEKHGDVNGDGTTNISDMTYLVSFLFSGGIAPVPC